MSISNAPTIESLDRMSVDEVAALPVEYLHALDFGLSLVEEVAKKRRAKWHAAMVKRYGKNTIGTLNASDGAFAVKIVTAQTVKWDQGKLRERRKKLVEAGNDPADFIDEDLSIPESRFKAFPKDVREWFMSARTVKPGKPRVSIERVS